MTGRHTSMLKEQNTVAYLGVTPMPVGAPLEAPRGRLTGAGGGMASAELAAPSAFSADPTRASPVLLPNLQMKETDVLVQLNMHP